MPSPSDPLCSIPLPSRFATGNPRGRWRPGRRRRLGRPRRLPPPSSSSPRRLPPRRLLPDVRGKEWQPNLDELSTPHVLLLIQRLRAWAGRSSSSSACATASTRRGSAPTAPRCQATGRPPTRTAVAPARRWWGCARRWCSTRGGHPRGGRRSGSCTSSAWKTTTRSLPLQGTTISRKTGCCAGYCTRVEPLQGHHLKRPALDDSLLLFPSRCQ